MSTDINTTRQKVMIIAVFVAAVTGFTYILGPLDTKAPFVMTTLITGSLALACIVEYLAQSKKQTKGYAKLRDHLGFIALIWGSLMLGEYYVPRMTLEFSAAVLGISAVLFFMFQSKT